LLFFIVFKILKLDIIYFRSTAANYIVYAVFNALSGYICYGILPIFMSKIGLTNSRISRDIALLINKNIHPNSKFSPDEIILSENENEDYYSS